jgi:mevalonate kinase
LEVVPLDMLLPISVIYSGHKVATKEAIDRIGTLYLKFPELFNSLYGTIDCVVTQAVVGLKNQDFKLLGELFNIGQGLMVALGVSTPRLDALIEELRAQPGIFGAKISGSGFGDCIIGIGSTQSELAINLSRRGVLCE